VVAKKEVALMDRRFTALRIIGTVFKILAWISLIFGLLGAIGMLVLGLTLSGQQALFGLDLGGTMAGIAMFVVVLVISIFGFLSLYAIGESVYLFLSIEENTRRTAYIIQQQYSSASFQAPHAVPATTPDYED
jgi:ABC-type long-subunit fatty acid transport system fused permease/ATPase subunit